MFEALSKGFRAARNRLKGEAELNEGVVDVALRDVRLSLLEADVEFRVAKDFLARVREQALGTVVRTRVKDKGRTLRATPEEQFIRICQEELTAMMADDRPALTFAPRPKITGIMMVGLQGSGKTTTSAKLARLLTREHDRKPLLVAADVARPGAIEQLQVLGERIEVPVFAIPGGRPLDICEQALSHARRTHRDTIIYDTAGRLAVDDALMEELDQIKQRVRPECSLLVVDAMIGQDSVNTAAAFHQRLGLDGVVLTKLDGDARGGAALSVRKATGAPVAFVGMGEGLDRLEPFRPDGMASRILGFGDVVGLMKDFEGVVDQQKAEQDAQRMLQGRFTLDDFVDQIGMLQQMGPLQDVLEKMPFFGDSVPEGFQVDDRDLVKTKAIVRSMTRAERQDIALFQRQPNRLKRVAAGSGRPAQDVAELLQRFAMMQQMMGQIGQQAGMLAKIPGMKQLAAAQRMRDVVKTGGLEHNPMMANLAESLLEAAVAGEGGAPAGGRGSTARRPVSKEKRRSLRKMQKKARRKGRR